MALIIRKLEKGNKIKKYENPAKELDFSASAITGNSNNSNSNSGITDFSKLSISGNSQSSNLDFSANSIIGKPKIEPPKTIIFKKNGLNTDWTIDDIKNMMIKVQDRTLANKQLNQKESTEANNWLLQLILNVKESVDITNKGIYIDGVAITTPEAFYEGYDGLLRKKYSKNYAGDLLARQAGVILEGSNNSSGTGAGTKYSPFDLPTLNITSVNNSKNPDSSDDSDDPNEEKTADLLAIEAFNNAHKTKSFLRQVSFKNPNGGMETYYVFNKDDNGNYYLAKKDANGNYVKVDQDLNYLIYDDQTNKDYGNIYTGVNGVYRLINKDNKGNENTEYRNAFDNIYNPFFIKIETIKNNIRDNYKNKTAFYNPHISDESSPYVDFSNNFSHIGTGGVSNIYINANSPTTHFGLYSIPELTNGIVVLSNGEKYNVDLHSENGHYYVTYKDNKNNLVRLELGSLSPTQTIENGYIPFTFEKLYDSNNKIDDRDIFYSTSNDNFRVLESDDWNRNDDDEFVEYGDKGKNAVNAIKNTVNRLLSDPIYYSKFNKDLEHNFNKLLVFFEKFSNKWGENTLETMQLKWEIQRLYDYILKKKKDAKLVISQKNGGKLRLYQSGGLFEYLKNNPNTQYQNNIQTVFNTPLITNKAGKEYANLDEFSETDYLRGAALAGDAASLFGGPVGAVAGLAATALEGVADVTDALQGRMEWTDALKNVGINLGFTLLAIVPGLGALKGARGAVKGGTKLVKTLGKLENVAKVAEGVDDTKDSAKLILKAANESLDYKDIKNILKASNDILTKHASELSPENLEKAQSLIDTCEKAIKMVDEPGKISKAVGKAGLFVNTGMGAYGISSGFQSVGNIWNKVSEGDISEINLNDLHGLVAGVAGAKGVRNLYRTYAARKILVDKNPMDLEANIPLKHNDIEINIKSKGKSASKVKEALQSEIQDLKTRKADLETRKATATGQDKITIESELTNVNKKISDYETIETNFDTVYNKKWSGKAEDVGNTIKSKWKIFTDTFFEPDYSTKKLPDFKGRKLSGFEETGVKEAKRLGFTEDGFNVEDFEIPKELGISKKLGLNKDKKKFVQNKPKDNTEEIQFKSKESNKTQDADEWILEDINENNVSHNESVTSQTVLSKSNVNTSSDLSNEALVSDAISKIIKENTESEILKILNNLKNKLLNPIEKSRLRIAVNKIESIPVSRILPIWKTIDSLKKGGSVKSKIKKYGEGDATSSAKDPTKEREEIVKLLDSNKVEGSNNYDGQISKPNSWWSKLAIVPEAINIASKTANAWAGANKIFDIQQRKEAAKLQYPYLHLPVQEDLAGYQSQKDAINEGKVHLNRNLTSDVSLQKATNFEYNTQALKSIGQLNALRSQDLKDLRLRSFNLEYVNEQNRINVANQNNAIDVSLADYKRGLDAQRINTLTSIINTNLDLNGLLFNKMLDSATRLQAAKYKNALTLQYYDKTAFDNDYVTRYDTYEKSPIKQYETALGIGKDEIVTQTHINGLYNKYLEQHPNLTDDLKRSAKSGFDRLVGKTLQQYYDSAYKYHETSLLNEGRKYQSAIGLADVLADANKYFLTLSRFNGVPSWKKGGSFTETKYKTDSKSKDHHKKIALEYAKLMQKLHQENMKNALPFLLHSYKNTTSK